MLTLIWTHTNIYIYVIGRFLYIFNFKYSTNNISSVLKILFIVIIFWETSERFRAVDIIFVRIPIINSLSVYNWYVDITGDVSMTILSIFSDEFQMSTVDQPLAICGQVVRIAFNLGDVLPDLWTYQIFAHQNFSR